VQLPQKFLTATAIFSPSGVSLQGARFHRASCYVQRHERQHGRRATIGQTVENVREQRMRRIVFSLFLFRLRLPVLFFSYST
jgi:hypothetical protein